MRLAKLQKKSSAFKKILVFCFVLCVVLGSLRDILAAVPPIPVITSVKPHDGHQIELSWDSRGGAVTGYEVREFVKSTEIAGAPSGMTQFTLRAACYENGSGALDPDLTTQIAFYGSPWAAPGSCFFLEIKLKDEWDAGRAERKGYPGEKYTIRAGLSHDWVVNIPLEGTYYRDIVLDSIETKCVIEAIEGTSPTGVTYGFQVAAKDSNGVRGDWSSVITIGSLVSKPTGKALDPLINLVASFCLIGGSTFVVWGTIVIAGALKEKTGPALQSGIWQIVGGMMVVSATYMFKNMANNGDTQMLNNTFKIAGQYALIGGSMWATWGVVILAGAIRDKTGPALQSAIWQIIGGALIMVASYMFVQIGYTS